MAMGTPVVTTFIAIQAFQVKDGEHLLVADETQQFANAISVFLQYRNLLKQLIGGFKLLVQQEH